MSGDVSPARTVTAPRPVCARVPTSTSSSPPARRSRRSRSHPSSPIRPGITTAQAADSLHLRIGVLDRPAVGIERPHGDPSTRPQGEGHGLVAGRDAAPDRPAGEVAAGHERVGLRARGRRSGTSRRRACRRSRRRSPAASAATTSRPGAGRPAASTTRPLQIEAALHLHPHVREALRADVQREDRPLAAGRARLQPLAPPARPRSRTARPAPSSRSSAGA